MKARIVNKNESEFKSVNILITIESEEELLDLWHRLNFNHLTLNKIIEELHYKKYTYRANRSNPTINHNLWEVLDNIVRAKGISK